MLPADSAPRSELGARLATMQRVIFKVAVHPASLLPVQPALAQTRRMGRRARCGFHSSGRAASRSWTQAAMILLRRGIPVGLRRVLACSCADCRDAAAHRAE
jgi:hypothetical protein